MGGAAAVIHLVIAAAFVIQEPPPAAVARLNDVYRRVTQLGREQGGGDSIWPGFRPDTIPVLYVLPGQGLLLLGWRGAPPEGFVNGWQPSTTRGAASTGTELAGRRVAQVVVGTPPQSVPELVGLTVHEAFHVFQAASRQPGKRFGQGENSFLVSSYPVFDARNEAGIALEGRILAAAERARPRDRASKRALAHEFLAARESRHRALGGDFAAFEQLAELNEGLAEYALLRAGELTDEHPTFADRLAQLDGLTADGTLSIRLRYYRTGPAQAHLLDALAGPSWKARLMAENLTLQDALADASGYRNAERGLRRRAEGTFAMRAIEAAADTGVAQLRARRRAQVDSLLGAPGVLLVVTLEEGSRSMGLCGIDPQNLLQVDQGVLLHTRWVQPCAGDALQATFNTPVVQDRNAGTLRAVVGPDSTLRLTVAGQVTELPDGGRLENAVDVRLESPLFSLRAARADIVRAGRVLKVTVKT